MPDIQTLLPDTPEEDRIRKWREERHRVAETEKAERIRQRDEKRALDRIEAEHASTRALAALLPKAEDVQMVRKRIKRQTRWARLGFWSQFLVICLAPVAASAWYLLNVATPLYEAKSVFAVTTPGRMSDQNNTGLLGAANGPAHLQDVFMAHTYIKSHALMDDLETDLGVVTRLSGDALDPIQRLRDVPMLSFDRRQQFNRFVNSSVDIQSGLLTLYVRAPSAAEVVNISETVLTRVAAQVNALNADVIDQRLTLATSAVTDAQNQIAQAQTELTALQLQSSEGDPAERIAGIYNQIELLETEAMALTQDIQKSEILGQEGSFQMQRTTALRDRLQGQIAAQRTLLTADGEDGQPSLSAQLMQYELANLRVDIAQEALSTSLAANADANHEAAMARSLFQVVVPPRTASQPMYPHAPRLLLLTFLASLVVFALFRMMWVGRRTV